MTNIKEAGIALLKDLNAPNEVIERLVDKEISSSPLSKASLFIVVCMAAKLGARFDEKKINQFFDNYIQSTLDKKATLSAKSKPKAPGSR